MKSILYLFSLSIIAFGCQSTKPSTPALKLKKDYTQFVNPFIGTSKMGHVFPGATVPFGMVQLSPQTNFEVMFNEDGSYNSKTYEYCAGYQHRDTTIIGFSHTNFSGTGHSDLGDFLVMPTKGELVLDPLKTKEGTKGFYSTFSHDREEASPGYYKVDLDSYGIKTELTASERVGFHQYTFPKTDSAHIILDLVYNVYHHDNKNVWTFIRVENDSLITGYRQTKGWARTRTVYFAMQFSKPFKSYGHKKYDEIGYDGFYRKFDQSENFPEMAGKDLRAYFNFDTDEGEEIKVKFALSPVSSQGAMNNLVAEIPHWDFNKTRTEAKEKWNEELSKIEVTTLSEEDKITFYTALYHTNLSPILYEDVDGQYRGLDQNIHTSEGFTNYTVFSLWDTYRALHPLFNITQPQRNNDMIKSMLAHHDQSVHHMLPIWSHYGNENWCMIGYHATSVIADAMVKNVGDFDRNHALEASVNTANVRYFDGLGDYIDYHYVPEDKSSSSVSKTLEYAYNDWCIAQMARILKNASLESEFTKRSEYFNALYDPTIGFMRPKLSDGTFKAEFNPMDTHGQGFIEGNAWNYGLYVPQNIEKMVTMMGGKERFSLHLDSLFTMEIEDKYIEQHEDITRDGIIGNYVHGNEPGHHIPYLYNWTTTPYKTQERVRMILSSMYGPTVNGLCGNDDAGQMSAWYVFSALGFYPVTPGSTSYALGSPLVKEAIIHLENGKTLTIRTKNQSKTNVYVQSVTVNGKQLKGTNLNHSDIMNGGEIIFVMSDTPSHQPFLEKNISFVKIFIMKLFFLTLTLFLGSYSFGQVFYKSYGKPEFKKLVANGVTYIKTGDTLRDRLFIEAIEKNWEATKFRIVDLSDEDNEEKVTEEDMVFFEAKIDGNEAIFGIIELSHLIKKTASKYTAIGFIVLDGFDQNASFESTSNFFDLTISGLNDVVSTIHSNKIKKIGSGLYKSIYSSLLPKSKSLKNKTLLIVGDTKKYVKTDLLSKNNIKYKLVSREEYTEMLEEDLSEYCLLYFAYNSYTEISIYDLSDSSLIYSRHYASAKSKLSGGDIADIVKQW